MNTKQPHTAESKKLLPDSPMDGFLDLIIGMNNGRTEFVFDFETEKKAFHFTEMTESITRPMQVWREKNIVTVKL